MGRGDQVRLLVNHEDQGSKQARLRRTEHTKEFGDWVTYRLNMEIDPQSLFGLLSTAVLIG